MGYSCFENKDCEYYPCHRAEEINCLFCFCPLYSVEDCGGNPKIIDAGSGEKIRDCSDCTFPHMKENYDKIMEKLGKINKDRR